jgi:hypothetical protein
MTTAIGKKKKAASDAAARIEAEARKPGRVSMRALAPPKTRGKARGFSGLEKKQLNVDIPIELWNDVTNEAVGDEVSKGLLLTVILSHRYHRDPAKFGIVTD